MSCPVLHQIYSKLDKMEWKSIMQTRVMAMSVSGIFHGLLTQSLHHIMTMGRRDSVTVWHVPGDQGTQEDVWASNILLGGRVSVSVGQNISNCSDLDWPSGRLVKIC